LPSYAELEGFECICRWLDAQPKRRARLPFVGLIEQLGAEGAESAVPTALLVLLRKYRVVRHTSTCEWALSPTWKARLTALWHGVDRELRERFPAQLTPSDPCVVAAGIDTWYLNRIDPAGLPLSLRHALDALQAQAAEDEQEVDTRWVYDGTPLRMYRAGANTNQGGGVSWSYILRNTSLTLLIRRVPLGGIVAQARLGSECLWRLTPRRALDELDALIRRLWARPLPFRRKDGQSEDAARWQVSQLHLAVDVANAPLDLEQASRFVSRSRSQAIYEAAKAEVEQLLCAVDGEDREAEPLLMDWDALYTDEGFDAFDGFDAFGLRRERDDEPEPIDDRAVTVYRYGRRLSGMTFSPGGDVSMVLYDKVLQARLRGVRHMAPIWATAGWQPGVGVTRHEARLRRPAVRELGLPGDLRSCLDDPWECLTHLKDIFAAVVGRAEPCPDATDVAWIRRVVPDDGDRNRSRWPTDPAWHVVQAARFTDAPAEARRLIRRRQRAGDIAVLDGVQFGCLVSRVATLHPNGGEWTLSRALGEAVSALDAIEGKKAQAGRDFGELVRERRRQFGLPLPVADKVFPFRPRPSIDATPEYQPLTSDEHPTLADPSRQRVTLAEGRVADAWAQLQEAEQVGRSRRVLDGLEAAYLAELATLTNLTEAGRDVP
jgi:hypothetical protein